MTCGVRPKDYLGEIKALFEWVQRNIRYTRDPHRVELLHSARRLLELRAGDCDDMTILLGSMLQSIGHPVRIVVVGPDPLRPRLFTHVYPEVRYRGRWIALDATMPHPMGWAPAVLVKKVISLRRRPAMRFEAVDDRLGQTTAGATANLVAAVRGRGLRPRDGRVRTTWELLRSRGLLRQDLWVRGLLRRLWATGLPPGDRPRTAARLANALRGWGLLTQGVPVETVPYQVTPGQWPRTYPLYRRRWSSSWGPGPVPIGPALPDPRLGTGPLPIGPALPDPRLGTGPLPIGPALPDPRLGTGPLPIGPALPDPRLGTGPLPIGPALPDPRLWTGPLPIGPVLSAPGPGALRTSKTAAKGDRGDGTGDRRQGTPAYAPVRRVLPPRRGPDLCKQDDGSADSPVLRRRPRQDPPRDEPAGLRCPAQPQYLRDAGDAGGHQQHHAKPRRSRSRPVHPGPDLQTRW